MCRSRARLSIQDWQSQVDSRYGSLAAKFRALYPAEDEKTAGEMQKVSARDRGQASMYLWSSKASSKLAAPIYTYYFNQAIPWPEHPEYGSFHSGELLYAFANLDKMNRPFTSVDRRVEAQASQYLVNFIRSGDPNGTGLPTWNPFSASEPKTFEFGQTSTMRPLMSEAKLDFWKEYFNSPQARTAPMF